MSILLRPKELLVVSAVIVLIVLAVMLALELARSQSKVEKPEQLYQGIELDPELLAIDRQALTEAYRAHLQLLFSVWLKDDVGVTHRINLGLRNARRAFHEARSKLDERERQLKQKQDAK